MVDARLPDGSRVNAVIPPLSVDGPMLTIRKFSNHAFTAEDLVKMGTLSRQSAEFLDACVRGKRNILISGGTGTGKTTLLNVVSLVHPRRRTHRHHRGRGRTPASASGTSSGSRPALRTSKERERSRFANWSETRSACAPIASSSARFVVAKPWTCCRP